MVLNYNTVSRILHVIIPSIWNNNRYMAHIACISPQLLPLPQQTFTCSNSAIKILEKVWNMFKLNNKDTRTTSLNHWTKKNIYSWELYNIKKKSYFYNLFFCSLPLKINQNLSYINKIDITDGHGRKITVFLPFFAAFLVEKRW